MSKAQYIQSELDGLVYCKTNGQFTRHLQKYSISYKEYYETYITGVTPLCYCKKPLKFYQGTHSYAYSCGNDKCVGVSISNAKKSWSDEQRLADSNNKKLAAKNKTKEQKEKTLQLVRKTCMEKYGVNWSAQSEIQKEKSKKTKLERYGYEYYNNSESSSFTNRNKTVEEKNKINEQRRKTNLKRYGVESTFLFSDNNRKSNKGNASIKSFVLPSGKIIGVRGYEPTAINLLLSAGYSENDLIIHDDYSEYAIEVFEYIAENRHRRKYYPDIYIKKENKIIEVKSRWWWDGNGLPKYESRLKNNLKKRKAVIDKGYIYELWLFTDKTTYKILKDDADF